MPSTEEKRKKVQKTEKIDVRQFVRGDLVFDGEKTTGWVHTHGMWENFELPDLEIIGVRPIFLMQEAGILLNHIAQYMLDGQMGIDGAKSVKLGQSMGMSPLVTVMFELSTPLNPEDKDEVAGHYTTPRWRIVQASGALKCSAGGHQE